MGRQTGRETRFSSSCSFPRRRYSHSTSCTSPACAASSSSRRRFSCSGAETRRIEPRVDLQRWSPRGHGHCERRQCDQPLIFGTDRSSTAVLATDWRLVLDASSYWVQPEWSPRARSSYGFEPKPPRTASTDAYRIRDGYAAPGDRVRSSCEPLRRSIRRTGHQRADDRVRRRNATTTDDDWIPFDDVS